MHEKLMSSALFFLRVYERKDLKTLRMNTLAIYIFVLSSWFVSMFIFYKKSQWETGVLKRRDQSDDPKCKAMRRELFTFLEVASKPMAQAADWYTNLFD